MTWKTKRGIGMAYYISLILNYQNICALKIKQKSRAVRTHERPFSF